MIKISSESASGGGGDKSSVKTPAASSVALLESGGLNTFVELLSLLRLLHSKGTITDMSLEHLSMTLLHTALSANPRLQLHVKASGLMETLVSGLGWPPAHLAGVPGEPLEQSIFDEFSRQQLILKIVCQAVYLNIHNLQLLSDLEGFARFTSLLRWSAWTFSESGKKEGQKPSQHLMTAGECQGLPASATLEDTKADAGSSTFTQGSAEAELEAWNRQVAEVCSALCSLFLSPSPSGAFKLVGCDKLGNLSVYCEEAIRRVVVVFLDMFSEEGEEPKEYAKEVAALFSHGCTKLQSYVLYVLRKIMAASSPRALLIFRECSVWDSLFSPYFFYFGVHAAVEGWSPPGRPLQPHSRSSLDAPFMASSSNNNNPGSGSGLALGGPPTLEVPLTPQSRQGWAQRVAAGDSGRGGSTPLGRQGGGDSGGGGGGGGRGGVLWRLEGACTPGTPLVSSGGSGRGPVLLSSLLSLEGVGLSEGVYGGGLFVASMPEWPHAASLRLEVITLVEAAATQDDSDNDNDNISRGSRGSSSSRGNKPEVHALLEALYRCCIVPQVASVLVRCVHRVLQLTTQHTTAAMEELDAALLFAKVMEKQQQVHIVTATATATAKGTSTSPHPAASAALPHLVSSSLKPHSVKDVWWVARASLFSLFEDYLAASEAAQSSAASNWKVVSTMFGHLEEQQARGFALKAILMLLKAPSKSKWSNMGLYSKFVKTIKVFRENHSTDVMLLRDLLATIREVVSSDDKNYRALFVEGGCLEELVYLLGAEYSSRTATHLCLEILYTLISLLENNKAAKSSFASLPCVGPGYQHLVPPVLTCYQQAPDAKLLAAAMDLMVDGGFDTASNAVIENEDAVLFFFAVVKKCHLSLQLEYLSLFESLLSDSTANCATCVRLGLMAHLLAWLAGTGQEEEEEEEGEGGEDGSTVSQLQSTLALLIQSVGSHSLSGKELRSVFALLRSSREGRRPGHGGLLLRTMQAMVKEDGPTVFFELNGKNSGLQVSSPVRVSPHSRGLSFCCWLRLESFPAMDARLGQYGAAMGVLSFATQHGHRGYSVWLQPHRLQVIVACNVGHATTADAASGVSGSSGREHLLSFAHHFHVKRWYFVALTHNVGQLLSGASQLKVYVDGKIVDSVKAPYPKFGNEPLTDCSFASSLKLPKDSSSGVGAQHASSPARSPSRPFQPVCSALRGQLGPVYVFEDALSGVQVEGMFLLGPSYMYSFSTADFTKLPQLGTGGSGSSSSAGNSSGNSAAGSAVPSTPRTSSSSSSSFSSLPGSERMQHLQQGRQQQQQQQLQILASHGLLQEGLASKILLSYNAQASSGGHVIFDTSPLPPSLDASHVHPTYDAHILSGVQLCYRQRIQDVIHCVGGIGVLFPLLTQLDQPMAGKGAPAALQPPPSASAQFAVDIVGLLTSILSAGGSSGQWQSMLSMSGFACLGFLLQRVAPSHLTLRFVMALENLLGCVAAHTQDPGLADALVKEAVARLYLNPRIWIYCPYPVQRELYLSLLREVERSPPHRLRGLCGLLPLLDIARLYYWEERPPASSSSSAPASSQYGAKPLVHAVTGEVMGTRPSPSELSKLRALLLSIVERSVHDGFDFPEAQALVAFLEMSKDPALLEDVLNALLSFLGKKSRASQFVQHVYALGGCHVFLSLLSRDQEAVRLLGLRLLCTVLLATPHEQRGGREPPSGHPLSAQERQWVESRAMAPLFASIQHRLRQKPITDDMWSTMLEMMTGSVGTREAVRHWQSLRKVMSVKREVKLPKASAMSEGLFVLPQMLPVLFRLLATSGDHVKRREVLGTVVRMLEGTPGNKEIIVKEPWWQQWPLDLLSVVRSDMRRVRGCEEEEEEEEAEGARGGVSACAAEREGLEASLAIEESLLHKFCVLVHGHAVCTLKAGWHPLEKTLHFLHALPAAHKELLCVESLSRAMVADVFEAVLKECPSQSALMAQPCRDNCLFLLTMVDTMALRDGEKYITQQQQQQQAQSGSTAVGGDAGIVPTNERKEGDFKPAASPAESFPQTALPPPPVAVEEGQQQQQEEEQEEEKGGESAEELQVSKWRLYGAVWAFLKAINESSHSHNIASFLTSHSLLPPPAHLAATEAAAAAATQQLKPSASFGQRARGLVDSLNPQSLASAGESVGLAASSSIGGGGGGGGAVMSSLAKGMERAVKLRGDRCPPLVFRLMLLYLYEAELSAASECMQQLLALLPLLTAVESESLKNNLHHFLWELKSARYRLSVGGHGERMPMVAQLIHGTLDRAKSVLVASLAGKKVVGGGGGAEAGNSGSSSSSSSSSPSLASNALDRILQHDRIAAALSEAQRVRAAYELRWAEEVERVSGELEEWGAVVVQHEMALQDKTQATMGHMCSQENVRRVGARMRREAEEQAVEHQWLQLYRDLTSERGSWSSGRSPSDPPLRWKLDKVEDPYRRRPRMRLNYRFDPQLLEAPREENRGRWGGSRSGRRKTVGFEEQVEQQQQKEEQVEGAADGEEEGGSLVTFLMKPLKSSSISGNPGHEEVGAEEEDDADSSQVQRGNSEWSEEDAAEEEAMAAMAGSLPPPSHQGGSGEAQAGGSAGQREAEAADHKVVSTAACVLVTAKRKLAGRLELTRSHLHFHSDFIVHGNGGCSVFDDSGNLRAAEEVAERAAAGGGGGGSKGGDIAAGGAAQAGSGGAGGGEGGEEAEKKQKAGNVLLSLATIQGTIQKDIDLTRDVKVYRNWALGQVRQVHLTRYLLQLSGIEVFFVGARPPVFFNFSSPSVARETATKLTSLATAAAKAVDRDREVVLVDKRKAQELAAKVRQRWQNRLMTNFEYLMTLNTLAGRSYNDIMQYPVFPWVLADYTSQELDLNNPAVYRDLSKPMGALDDKRFQTFQERYHSFLDPEIPSFFYGSHYSTAGTVLFYLLRTEPFSSLNRSLQGGKFDHADRLFHSIASTWSNCLTNSSDVKELIPEFYYMPEFLTNHNEYYLGKKQDGRMLGDVVLPPWANGSPEVFVHKCREALESEYVSSQLNAWIDLIFGFKQKGPNAVEAANVFYYLTYEGAVNLESIQDPYERAAVEDQIANFGQTPLQLFTKQPHPRRLPPSPISRPLYYAPKSITLTSTTQPSTNYYSTGDMAEQQQYTSTLRSDPEAITFIGVTEGKAVTLSRGLVMSVRSWITPGQAGFTFSGGADGSFGLGDSVLSRHIGTPFSGSVDVFPNCFDVFHAAGMDFLLTCGHWDNSFQCVSVGEGRTVRSIRQHNDVVTCLSVSSDGSCVVTGSRDTTVMVWDVLLIGGGPSRGLYAERHRLENVICDKPRAVLSGHDDAVLCVVVKSELDLVVSGSKDGTCILHTLSQGRYLRTIQNISGAPVDRLCVTVNGHLLIYSHTNMAIHSFSINGKWLATVDNGERINCMSLSGENEFLVTGGVNGSVVARWAHSLEDVCTYTGVGVPVTGLFVTQEDCFLVGLEDGRLLVYSVETQQLKRTSPHFHGGK